MVWPEFFFIVKFKTCIMKNEEIHFGDIKRWLFGQMPPEFMIEVAIRSFLIFLILIVVMRLMGKRMSGQITFSELAVVITLGAIVSPVMQLPDRAIFFGVTVLGVALFFQRGLNLLAFKNEKIEHLSQGKMSLLIKDGILDLKELDKAHITRQQIFGMLREKKIQNLGKVKRAYLEACGIFTVYETEEKTPGLPIFPKADTSVNVMQEEVSDHMMACSNCGHVQKINNKNAKCDICHSHKWAKAYFQLN
jgi:uncharacterized membrane protein YcaP (DUF421 family)